MKRIALITFAGLALFATAAAAHQNGWGNNYKRGNNGHMQQVGYTGGGCPMNTNMMGWSMNGNQGMMGPGMRGNATRGAQTNNWRTTSSYQGQVDDTTTTGK